MAWPRPARTSRISSMDKSGVSARMLKIKSLQASTRPERRSLPKGPGFVSPCVRANALQRLTLAALTPKRSAARCDKPESAAARTRRRRSTERAVAISAGLLPGGKLESFQQRFGNLEASVRSARQWFVSASADVIEAGLNEGAVLLAAMGKARRRCLFLPPPHRRLVRAGADGWASRCVFLTRKTSLSRFCR